jgi:hypothetical protein
MAVARLKPEIEFRSNGPRSAPFVKRADWPDHYTIPTQQRRQAIDCVGKVERGVLRTLNELDGGREAVARGTRFSHSLQ